MSLLPALSMSTLSVEFPLSPIRGKKGIVPEPIVPLAVKSAKAERIYDFLVDSGADATLLPRSLADDLGINLKRCPWSVTQGVEGKGIKIYNTFLKLKIGQWEDRIHCAFASHDHIPPLLGRLDVFSLYTIIFEAKRKSIIFHRV